jgi:hypothetical protein
LALKEACNKALNLITFDLSEVLEFLISVDTTESGEFKGMPWIAVCR